MVKQFKWYPAENVARKPRTKKAAVAKLRKGVEPGKVLILLSGRYRGHRVVCLKRLDSGLLLVAGPQKINGVPLKRVNQVYTITTSQKVNLAGVDVSKISDKDFTRDKKAKNADRKLFEEGKKSVVNTARRAASKAVNDALIKNIKDKKNPLLAKYMAARFSLTKNDRPHAMRF